MPYFVAPDGYYTPDQARIAWLEHLEDVLGSLVHIASVDAFQAWIYTDPAGADRDARDAKWLELRKEFEAGVDWTGLERERVGRWYRQLHIFELPFYYIEYGIAQLGALQMWMQAKRHPANALGNYKKGLALGASQPLPKLFEASGLRFSFGPDTIGELMQDVGQTLAKLPA